MCILLYVKLLLGSGIPYIYGQLGGYIYSKYIALCYILNIFGVVVFHMCMVN